MCRNIVFFIILIWVNVLVAQKVIVKVKQGNIIGHREATVFDKRLYFAFYGVPYAEPPIEHLRFKDPRPIGKWNGILDARTAYHGACAQSHIVHKTQLYGVEDCLYLNIYTTSLPRSDDVPLMPVIVWIHGYAFSSCFSHVHGPDFLITKGVVLVTLAHRIGVFGFLKSNKNTTNINMGLKDIVLGLKWIRTNIKQFGGDKKKVTLMGHNSGATFISLLMTTKASKLFSKVILQSGTLFSPSIFQGNPRLERSKLQKELKQNKLKLRTAPTLDILRAAHRIYSRNSKQLENLQRPLVPFTPVIEENLNSSLLIHTPQQFFEAVKKTDNYFKKPILIGYNSEESISEIIPFIQYPHYINTYLKNFKYMVPFADGCRYNRSSKMYKKVSAMIKDKYFKDINTKNSLANLLKYASDLLTYPILKFIKTHLSVGQSKMFMYKFDYRGKLNAVKATSIAHKKVKIKGAATGDEICYLFTCQPYWEYYGQLELQETNKDKTFIKEISQLWSNFAKFGDPTPHNNEFNLTWLPMTSDFNNILLIRKTFKVISTKKEKSIFDFWNNLYESYYRKDACIDVHDEL